MSEEFEARILNIEETEKKISIRVGYFLKGTKISEEWIDFDRKGYSDDKIHMLYPMITKKLEERFKEFEEELKKTKSIHPLIVSIRKKK